MDLPSDQRRLLQVIFERFHETGEWPSVDDLRFELDDAGEDLDVPEVAKRLAPGYADIQSGGGVARLTIHGVAACAGSQAELDDLVEVSRYAYRLYRESHGHARFTGVELAADLRMDDLRVHRVQRLLGGLPWDGGGGGSDDGSWYRIVNSDIVRFKPQTAAELLAMVPLPRRYDATVEGRTSTVADDLPVTPAVGAAPELGRRYPYDVALSFAGEQRAYVELVAADLKSQGVKVFYDAYERVVLWGKDLYTHFDEVYQKQARFAVVFASAEYASKAWPKHELRSAQARALKEKGEYLLPARFDDTEIPGVPSTISYIDLRSVTPAELSTLIQEKLRAAESPHGRLGEDPTVLEALALQQQVLATRTRVLGPDHPDTLGTANNLADTLRLLGRLPEARTLQQQVLAARTRVLGPDHPDTLGTANNLADTLRMMHERG